MDGMKHFVTDAESGCTELNDCRRWLLRVSARPNAGSGSTGTVVDDDKLT
jgi:hypothetical protein